jgi:tetratricopeptide (TPR) repeat protein
MHGFVRLFSSHLRIWLLALGIFAAAIPSAGRADTAVAFHQAVSDAYGHYREAFFYLRRGNAMTAAFELEAMIDKWQAMLKAHGQTPPVPYAKDSKWLATLKDVGSIAESALESAGSGAAEPAYEMLKPVRGMLRDMRERNGVRLFRDEVEDANAAFNELFEFRRNPPDFSDPASVAALREKSKKTIDAYQTCLDKAPPAMAKDEQFQRLLTDSLRFLKRIDLAIEEKNPTTVINILRRVVSSNNILWMRFG